MLPEFTAAAPAQVPFRNQSMFTFPVGTGPPSADVTDTKSCTVLPAATVVTTWCAALWMLVAVAETRLTITVCELTPTVRSLTGQFVEPGPLQRSVAVYPASIGKVLPGRLKS